ncbi:MAG TPA: aldose 1-epimerase family protein [Ohtaekwangia sp.]
MEYVLQNQSLIVKIKDKGAELFSVVHKQNQLEYMWSGDPLFWGKTSPVLFPIVGALRDNAYLYKDKKYTLSRHGFARDHSFGTENQEEDKITFLLISNESTLQHYPFPFELRIIYSITAYTLSVTYEVKNTGNDVMFFSLGAHPAFKVPIVNGSAYTDYYLEFNRTENSPRWPISNDGLIKTEPEFLLTNTNKLPLDKKLFENDALVLKHLKSDAISLKSTKHNHGLEFTFEGFPFFGIWAAKNADFVCLEPWCGIADAVDHDQQLHHKEGIESLRAGRTWSRAWHIKVF